MKNKNMKLMGLLLTTALVTACGGDSSKDNKAADQKGGKPSPAVPVIPAPQPGIDLTTNPVASYVHASDDPETNNLFAAGDEGRSSLVDPKMIHEAGALFDAEETAKEMDPKDVVVHTLGDVSVDERLPHADAKNPSFYDIFGNKGKYNKAYLDTDMKVTAFAAGLADIEMRKGAAFDASALLIEDSVINLDGLSKVQVGALYVGAGSKVTGEGAIEQHPASEDAHGMVFDVLAKERKDFGWAKEGMFIVDGFLNRLTVKNGMTLSSQSNAGSVDQLVLDGGVVALKASTPFEVGSLSVKSGSVFNFGWDSPKSQVVLSVMGDTSTNGDLKINLTELSKDVAEGSSIQLIGFTGAAAKGFAMGDMFGAKVMLESSAKGVTLILNGRGLNAALKGAASQFAQDALNGPMGSKLAVMDASTTAKAFEASTAESSLNNRVSTVNFCDLHATLEESKVGVVSSATETAAKMTQSIGYAFSNGLVLAFSATKDEKGDKKKQPQDEDQAELLGLHFGKSGFFVDVFAKHASSQKASYGFDTSYKFHGVDFGLNYNHGKSSHETNSVIGNVSIPNFHHDSASVYVGLSSALKQLDAKPANLSSRIGYDVYSCIASHTAYLNGYAVGMDTYSPLKSVTAELDAEIPFAMGSFQVSYGVRSNQDFTGQFAALRFKVEM